VTFEILTKPPECLPAMVLSPKDWRGAHDAWVHSMMRAAMNNKDLLGIPCMAGLKEGMQSKITKKHLLTPMHAFMVNYNF